MKKGPKIYHNKNKSTKLRKSYKVSILTTRLASRKIKLWSISQERKICPILKAFLRIILTILRDPNWITQSSKVLSITRVSWTQINKILFCMNLQFQKSVNPKIQKRKKLMRKIHSFWVKKSNLGKIRKKIIKEVFRKKWTS